MPENHCIGCGKVMTKVIIGNDDSDRIPYCDECHQKNCDRSGDGLKALMDLPEPVVVRCYYCREPLEKNLAGGPAGHLIYSPAGNPVYMHDDDCLRGLPESVWEARQKEFPRED